MVLPASKEEGKKLKKRYEARWQLRASERG